MSAAAQQSRSPRLLECMRTKLPPPIVVRGFLSEADIDDIFSFGREMQVVDGMGLVRYGSTHVALWLHHGGVCDDGIWRSFEASHAVLLEKMLSRVRRCAHDAGLCLPSIHLNVRCIELHLYKAGGGLTDTGHYDQGSVLTLSVQLSPPGPNKNGGRFSTTDAYGVETVHELARGDAIIFCSEQVHNVSTLASGTERNSLVIELWEGRTNRRDRFK